MLGLQEELGELAHALLKQRQGIRGDPKQLEADAQDAAGDVMIYLLDLCNKRGWDLDNILNRTWAIVGKRDWQADPETGGNHDHRTGHEDEDTQLALGMQQDIVNSLAPVGLNEREGYIWVIVSEDPYIRTRKRPETVLHTDGGCLPGKCESCDHIRQHKHGEVFCKICER